MSSLSPLDPSAPSMTHLDTYGHGLSICCSFDYTSIWYLPSSTSALLSFHSCVNPALICSEEAQAYTSGSLFFPGLCMFLVHPHCLTCFPYFCTFCFITGRHVPQRWGIQSVSHSGVVGAGRNCMEDMQVPGRSLFTCEGMNACVCCPALQRQPSLTVRYTKMMPQMIGF